MSGIEITGVGLPLGAAGLPLPLGGEVEPPAFGQLGCPVFGRQGPPAFRQLGCPTFGLWSPLIGLLDCIPAFPQHCPFSFPLDLLFPEMCGVHAACICIVFFDAFGLFAFGSSSLMDGSLLLRFRVFCLTVFLHFVFTVFVSSRLLAVLLSRTATHHLRCCCSSHFGRVGQGPPLHPPLKTKGTKTFHKIYSLYGV